MKFYLPLIALLFIINSCNKNQQTVKKIDGNWYATKYVLNENGEKSNLLKMGFKFNFYFDNCKLKKNNYCQVTTTLTNKFSNETNVLMYKVIDNGKTLKIKDPTSLKTENTYTIEKLNYRKLILTLNKNNFKTEITLIKE